MNLLTQESHDPPHLWIWLGLRGRVQVYNGKGFAKILCDAP